MLPAGDWPLGQLTSLDINTYDMGVTNALAPIAVLRLLAGSVGARCTLRRLRLKGAPLDEAVTAAPLCARTALCCFDNIDIWDCSWWECSYADEWEIEEEGWLGAVEDARTMRIWLSRRLPDGEVHMFTTDM